MNPEEGDKSGVKVPFVSDQDRNILIVYSPLATRKWECGRGVQLNGGPCHLWHA